MGGDSVSWERSLEHGREVDTNEEEVLRCIYYRTIQGDANVRTYNRNRTMS
jgi:hypothetical protein